MHARGFLLFGIFLMGCPSGGEAPTSAPFDAGAGVVSNCSGDEAHCLRGTVTTDGFRVPFANAKVELLTQYPSGTAAPFASVSAGNGVFALGMIPDGSRYYLRAVAVFGEGASAVSVASVIGPIAIPRDPQSVDMKLRPVFVEALQLQPASAALGLSWARARVVDPATGHPIDGVTAMLEAGGQSFPMAQTPDPGVYFTSLPSGTPGGTSFAVTTRHALLGADAQRWTLSGEAPTFTTVLVAPKNGATVAKSGALEVSWAEAPEASYTTVELYFSQSGAFDQRYASPLAACAGGDQGDDSGERARIERDVSAQRPARTGGVPSVGARMHV